MCMHECVCVHMCFKPETRTAARGFLHLVAHEWRQTPQASGSKRRREGGEAEVLGEPFVLLTLRPLQLIGIELWYWVQSARIGLPPSGTPYILNSWGQEEVLYTVMLSSQIIGLPVPSQDQIAFKFRNFSL